MTNIVIRDQTEADFAAVHELVIAAFKTMPYACGREQFLMDALWRTGAATAALVAEDAGAIVGQVAFSKVKVGGADVGWHGCGPLSVLPERQKQGVGGALMRAGLERLRALGSQRLRAGGRSGILSAFRLCKHGRDARSRRAAGSFHGASCWPAKRQEATWRSTRRLRRRQ